MQNIATALTRSARHGGPRPDAGPLSTHVLVCPPNAAWQPAPLWRRVLAWLAAPTPWGRKEDQRMANLRTEFVDAVADITCPETQALITRLQRARSLRELWHLRASVYGIVAVQRSQFEAESRLAQLNRHFPTRSPLSGFTPLH